MAESPWTQIRAQGAPGEEPEPAGPELRITVLTIAILALIGILLIFTGWQAAEAERHFFREVAMNANQEISTLVGRQFVQTFTNSTGLLEDMARFPGVVGREMPIVDELFGVLLKRHDLFRVLYMLDENGKTPHVRYNIGSTEHRDLPPEKLEQLKRREVTSVITDFYKIEEDPAIGFACAVIERKSDQFRGIIGAELNLDFMLDVITSVRVGRTGEILLVDPKGSIIFSSPGFTGIDEFKYDAATKQGFNHELAFRKDKGTQEYGRKSLHLSAYQRLRALPQKSGPLGSNISPMSIPIPQPGSIPDWLVVVQQKAEEAYLVADRMKYNLIILVVVGVIGLMVIARLWIDSL